MSLFEQAKENILAARAKREREAKETVDRLYPSIATRLSEEVIKRSLEGQSGWIEFDTFTEYSLEMTELLQRLRADPMFKDFVIHASHDARIRYLVCEALV
jgi:hypothetical protein